MGAEHRSRQKAAQKYQTHTNTFDFMNFLGIWAYAFRKIVENAGKLQRFAEIVDLEINTLLLEGTCKNFINLIILQHRYKF